MSGAVENGVVGRFEAWFVRLGRIRSFELGIVLGLVFVAAKWVVGEPQVYIIGFLIYFPFHAWLTITMFLVLLSRYERARFLGDGRSAIGAFFARLLGPFGLFCIAWFYTFVLGWGMITLSGHQ